MNENKLKWPDKNPKPLNEFKSLFPDGKGDPTNSATMRNATLAEKVRHLIKFAEFRNDQWIFRFASHPRFAYWAFNMIQT